MTSRLLVFASSCCFLAGFAARSVDAQKRPELGGDDALISIRQRYVDSLLPKNPEQATRLRALAAKYADSLPAEGYWPDVLYQDQDRAVWRAADHLNRALVMAKAARLDRNTGHPDAALEAKTNLALQRWLDRDLHNPNWWWNEIGIPQSVAEIATLVGPALPAGERTGAIAILKRSNWRRVPWTGANLIWGTEIEVLRGCLEDNIATVAEGYSRMYDEIRVVSQAEEGVQQDGSFHQHGQQLYNGGYGLTYADDLGRFIAFSWGTSFQVPPDRMAVYSAYVLDGMQWMIRGGVIDYSVTGREITRKGKNVEPRDWTTGPISPAGPGYSLGNVLDMLAAEPTPRQREFQQFAARLHREPALPFNGNKQFWCSDFMVHRTSAFSTSVKMLSSRMLNSELVNGEGRKSQHLSDGANFLYLTGDEYKDIFPVWDWTKVPGTTAIQGTLETGEPNAIGARGLTAFAGGVSDGTYGMAAMDLHRGALTAKKAWFFFDDSYLCLGAGITLAGDATHGVATDVNQTLLSGPVFTSESRTPLNAGEHTLSISTGAAAWAFHDRVGYVFAPNDRVQLSNASQSGRWSDLGSGSDAEVSLPVFNLWIDHGAAPQRAAYQYTVLPGATLESTQQYAKHPATRVLANNEQTQAAWNDRLQLGMIAFRQPGSLATPAGTVTVDHACLLMLRKTGQTWNITASNPENLPLTLHVTIGARHRTIDLPGGNFAGSSVTAPL